MGCGSSQSTKVIRSGKVAPMPMEDAPTDMPAQQVTPAAVADKFKASSDQAAPPVSSAADNGKEQATQVFVKPAEKAPTSQPSPTPSRKSMKSLSSSRGLGSSRKHGGSNKSLTSVRAEEKRKRDQMKTGVSSSSLSKTDKGSSSTLLQTDSKTSMRTADSGLGGDDETGGVHVTQSGVKVIRIDVMDDQTKDEDGADRPPTPDLSISGKAITSQKPSSAASRKNDRHGLEAPDKDTSIIQRPPSRGGMAFDILVASPDTGNTRRPPSRLAALDRRPSIDKELSTKQLNEKLRAAEKRKRQYEKENILSKVESQRQRSNQVQSALQAFAARQSQQTEGRMVLSQDKQAENREAQLEARRNKLKAQQEHAAKVRLAKQALVASNA